MAAMPAHPRIPLAALALAAVSCAGEESHRPGSTAEDRAVAYLAREVPAWHAAHRCHSCHNNGDAARALFAARKRAIPFDPAALEETTRWLARPDAWKDNGPEGEFSDRKLAALQFAAALAAAVDAGAAPAGAPLARAAEILRGFQEPDGSWKVDAEGLPGSPITWGRALATVAARQVLAAAGRDRFADAIARADEWLRRRRPGGVLDAAALLLAPSTLPPQRLESLEVLRRGQTADGGWGPFVTSPPEVFDTAVALLALATARDAAGAREMALRGREFLLAAQQEDGSWTETTRPPGVESYAHRISTTGWATLALLGTPAQP